MRIIEFFTTLFLSFILVLLIMNKSVHSYIEQKYHIQLFDTQNPILQTLNAPALWLDSVRSTLFPSQEDLALSTLESIPEPPQEQETAQEEEPLHYPLINDNGNIVLEEKSTFLFIGDSMMQGVGMTLGRELKKRGFSVIDIAKQSTGLTYVDFFDWGKTLKEVFAKNPHIDVVVIMVGANDPYNMPKIKYASTEWIEIYESRIQDILDTANAYGAVVVWYDAPIVKKEPLNSKLAFLNTLYRAKVAQAKALLLSSNQALAPNGIYTAYGKTPDGKSVKLRANDGIHFSGDGSRALGALLLDRLEIVEYPHADTESSEIIHHTSPHTNASTNTLENTSAPAYSFTSSPAESHQIDSSDNASGDAQNTDENAESNPIRHILEMHAPQEAQAHAIESMDSSDMKDMDFVESNTTQANPR